MEKHPFPSLPNEWHFVQSSPRLWLDLFAVLILVSVQFPEPSRSQEINKKLKSAKIKKGVFIINNFIRKYNDNKTLNLSWLVTKQ